MGWYIWILARYLLVFQIHLIGNVEKYILVILKCLNYLLKVKGLQCHNYSHSRLRKLMGRNLPLREESHGVKICFNDRKAE